MRSEAGMDVDDTERRVINALLRDGRASDREISAATGIAAPTVAQRREQLETCGIVTGYEPRIDYEALGYDVTAVFQLSVSGDAIPDLAERLSERERMIAVYEVTGTHDVVAVGKFRTTDAMRERITDLVTDEDVVSASTSVVLDSVTEYGQFPLDPDGD